VDTASVLGRFGKEAEVTARRLLECNLIHAMASDCHSPRRRLTLRRQSYRPARFDLPTRP